jgi:hypothetical protein
MSIALTIEERLAIVAKEIRELKHSKAVVESKPNWLEKITGTFKDDPEFGEILRLRRWQGLLMSDTCRLEVVAGEAK